MTTSNLVRLLRVLLGDILVFCSSVNDQDISVTLITVNDAFVICLLIEPCQFSDAALSSAPASIGRHLFSFMYQQSSTVLFVDEVFNVNLFNYVCYIAKNFVVSVLDNMYSSV